jgi:GxxExxY protein
MEFAHLSKRVIGCVIELHRELGPGLLESTYQQCVARELSLNGISFQRQYPRPIAYKGILRDCGYPIDMLIEDDLIIKLKAVEEIKGIHEAQLRTCMKLAGIKTGLLINFNVTKLKDGLKRYVL